MLIPYVASPITIVTMFDALGRLTRMDETTLTPFMVMGANVLGIYIFTNAVVGATLIVYVNTSREKPYSPTCWILKLGSVAPVVVF